MNCEFVKESLLDYIDGNLNNENIELIKEHLDTCSDCRTEYLDLKLTIDHITDNSRKINTEEDINLDTKINKRHFKRIARTGLIAAVFSLMFVITAFATDMFGFLEYWKKSSEVTLSAWEQLIENGVGQKLDISATDNDIKITAEGVISDEINTIILLKIEDLKGKERYIPDFYRDNREISITLDGDISSNYFSEDIPLWTRDALYYEDENTVGFMINTNPITKDEGNIDIQINMLTPFYSSKSVEDRDIIHGNWNISIPVKQIPAKTYIVNRNIDLDGNNLIINKVILAPTVTVIDYTLDGFNKREDYLIGDITFFIKSGFKNYERSELSYSLNGISYDNFVSQGESHLQSLYLKDPKDIDLIINTYDYKKKGFGIYDIDYDNLPQTIDYKGSKIVIEEMIEEDDGISLIIKEDDSRDRGFYGTDFYFNVMGTRTFMDGDEEITIKSNFDISSQYIDFETRDSKNRKVNLEKEDKWKDEFHTYVLKHKLTIDRDHLIMRRMDEESIKEDVLKPRQLYVQGPYYIKFPNMKVNIKLK